MGDEKEESPCVSEQCLENAEFIGCVGDEIERRTREISAAFDGLETWNEYLRGWTDGVLVGLRLARDLVQCASDRIVGGKSLRTEEPFPLDGLGTLSELG